MAWRKCYTIASPDGVQFEIPEELFLALSQYMGKGRPAGSVRIEFKNGAVAGVSSERRWK